MQRGFRAVSTRALQGFSRGDALNRTRCAGYHFVERATDRAHPGSLNHASVIPRAPPRSNECVDALRYAYPLRYEHFYPLDSITRCG